MGALILAGNQLGGSFPDQFVPPQCKPAKVASLQWASNSDGSVQYTIDLPLDLLGSGHQLIPCFSSCCRSNYTFLFTLEFRTSAPSWSATSLSPVGDGRTAILQPAGQSAPVRSEIDFFRLEDGLSEAHLVLQVWPDDEEEFLQAPALFSLDASQQSFGSEPTCDADRHVDIPVPPLTQMVDEDLGPRICSPTSVAMVLEHLGRRTDILAIARTAFLPDHDLYGIWPAAIYAASRHDALGYLLRFPNWEAARWLLGRGIPVVASIRYDRGELEDAAVPETAGHLVVVRGYTDEDVLVNDPAAPIDEVFRRYRHAQFVQAWLGGSGVGYIIFPPPE